MNKYEHHSGGVTCLKVVKGVLFSGSLDNTIKTWDGKVIRIFQEFSKKIDYECVGNSGWTYRRSY